MKRYVRLTAIAISTLMLLSGCGGGGEPGAPEAMGMMAPAEATQSATAVRTQEVSLSSISNEYAYSGSLQPANEVEVYSALSGKVATVNYDVGDRVQAGAVLFTMDTTDLESSVKVSEASVNTSQTSVDTARNNLEMANGSSMQTQIESAKSAITSGESSLKNAQTTVDNAQVALDNAKLNLDKAERNYNTYAQLYTAGGISQEAMEGYLDTYEQAKNSYTQAQLSLEQANIQYQSAQDSLEQANTNYDILVNQTSQENIVKAEDSLAQAEAQLESSKAQLESTRRSLEDAVVTAPISGVVSKCNVTAGASLSQGTTPFVIIDTDSLDVVVNVSEQLISAISGGDPVRISIPTASEEELRGTITSISPDANSDGTYEVKVNISNRDGSLKSGMFAQVYFTKEHSDNAIVISRDSVITKNGETYVYVVENGTAKRCDVVIGIDNGDMVEITSGLSVGMTLVTEGQTYLTEGEAVNDVTNKTAEVATEPASRANEA